MTELRFSKFHVQCLKLGYDIYFGTFISP